jgi:hypothetical protein
MMTPEKKERLKDTMLETLKFKQGEDFIEGMDELQREGYNIKSEKKTKKKKKKRKIVRKVTKKGETSQTSENSNIRKQATRGNILEESIEVDLDELARRDQKNLALRKQLFRGIECENSIYLFSKVRF